MHDIFLYYVNGWLHTNHKHRQRNVCSIGFHTHVNYSVHLQGKFSEQIRVGSVSILYTGEHIFTLKMFTPNVEIASPTTSLISNYTASHFGDEHKIPSNFNIMKPRLSNDRSNINNQKESFRNRHTILCTSIWLFCSQEQQNVTWKKNYLGVQKSGIYIMNYIPF